MHTYKTDVLHVSSFSKRTLPQVNQKMFGIDKSPARRDTDVFYLPGFGLRLLRWLGLSGLSESTSEGLSFTIS